MSDERARTRGDQPVIAAATVLDDRKDLAAFALEHTRMPMVVTDPRLPDNPIVLANGSFLEQTGYSAGEVIGRNCRFLQGRDTDAGAVDAIRAAVRSLQPLTIELLNYRKDGQSFWNQLHLCPVHDPGGELIYFFASQMDVTEQRKTRALENAEHALLLEVDHRAKNALALVQGIVRLSGRTGGADAYADAVTGRVDALAVAHGLLSEARWRNVGIDRLVTALVNAIGEPRFDVGGPASMLSPDQVQPLAIVLHELFINSLRHGALTAHDGECRVRWHSDGENIAIMLIEDLTAASPSPGSPGFGSRIVDQVVSRQLRGRVKKDWRPSGLTTTLTVPAQADRQA